MTLDPAPREGAAAASSTDDDVRGRIRAMGATLLPTTFADTAVIMAPLVRRPPGVVVQRDVTYGEHPRHRLDIFRSDSAAAGAARPVLVYVHGGGFVQGDKGSDATPFYDNIGRWAAHAGAVGVTMNYRLAPDHRWPSAAHDIAAALDLLHERLPALGGDPKSIFLMGQSAGAAHVASYVAMTDLHRGPPLAGAIMLSGLYDVEAVEHTPLESAHYGTDTSRFAQMSSLPGLVESAIPCLFSVAEYEPEKFQRQALLLVQRWFARHGALPRMLYLPDHNHMSPAQSVGRADDLLTREIGAFITKHAAR